MLICWLVSLRLEDASIVDPLWPVVFVAIAWGLWLSSSGGGGRKLLLAAMVTLWGLRLSIHLTARKRGEPEDYRYADMRRRWQPFALWSLAIVFGLQALLATVVSLPLQAVLGTDENTAVGWLDLLAGAVWAVGLVFETVADRQLARFRAVAANRGTVMDRGLWRYSRHPNYFGDFLVWWGIWLVAAAAGAWWTIIGPAIMTTLLVRVSGTALLERTISQRRPGYADYAARTSAFIPLPPRQSPSGTTE
ncbi:MAG: DUF1295 domain-containing protein [Acidimicrobiales bacterium]|nr:DUF1295 domain-containing protein [Acidimicrobiales bacterium]MYD82026.1 DUF1295 domain-containing protein [Acidimicrobiales bacterium]MYJ64426.1 DUF1295 domain-containing protein [Acidimicrobiales bacterium]